MSTKNDPTLATIPQVLEALYQFHDQARVAEYLQRHPELISVLIDARGQITRIFGAMPCVLEVNEYPTEPEHLTLSIQSHLSVDETLAKLDQFDETWWLDMPYEARENLLITVKYL